MLPNADADHHQSFMRWPDFPDYSFEFLKILDTVHEGAAAPEVCFATADRIDPDHMDSWYTEWRSTAELAKVTAEQAHVEGRKVTARSNWLRASNYFLTAQAFLHYDDPRRSVTIERMRICMLAYLGQLETEGEHVAVHDSESGDLDGYLVRAPQPAAGNPLVLCVGGWDDFKEENLIRLRRTAHERGISLLLIELPGIARGKKIRSERRFAAMVIDRWMTYLEERADVPSDDIAIYGVGMGAAFATESATLDARFKAVVCDGGRADLAIRAASFNEALAAGIDDAIGVYTDRLNDHSLLKQLRCPVLMTRSDDSWPGAMQLSTADSTYDAARADRKLSESSPVSPPILYEGIFDWLAGQLVHRSGRR
ncbi:MAG: hypothetical protein JWQ94_830 [Tardiphaga sp.]|nr:hypothetical protein [Tardiphaga sp.]